MTPHDVVAFIPQTPVFLKEIFQEATMFKTQGNGTILEIQANYQLGVTVKLILRDKAYITVLQRIKEPKTWTYELDFESLCNSWHILNDYCRILAIANTDFNPDVFEEMQNAKKWH